MDQKQHIWIHSWQVAAPGGTAGSARTPLAAYLGRVAMIQIEHSFGWKLKNAQNATEHNTVPKPLSKEVTGLFRTLAGNLTALRQGRVRSKATQTVQ